MGIHYVNGALIEDGIIDIGKPEAVMYEPGPDGSLELIAVDQSDPHTANTLGLHSAKVIVPGTLPMTFGSAAQATTFSQGTNYAGFQASAMVFQDALNGRYRAISMSSAPLGMASLTRSIETGCVAARSRRARVRNENTLRTSTASSRYRLRSRPGSGR